MYFLYSVVTAAGMILLSPYFLVQGIRNQKYLGNLRERLGLRFPASLADGSRSRQGTIWVHAVSVGETIAAAPLVRALRARFPRHALVVSTTTATGQAVARERMKQADAVFYFPLDWCGPVRRSLDATRPSLVVIVETEIWPNFLREARRRGVPVAFVNGRISERSWRRMSRAARAWGGLLRGFLRGVMNDATIYLMQSEKDRERAISLGAAPERVVTTGNLKYDLEPQAANAFATWLKAEAARSARGPLVVAGSVIAGEERPVLEGFRAVRREWPKSLLVMAPRKPERFEAAAEMVREAGWHVARRSRLALDNGAGSFSLGPESGADPEVLLLDSIGELAAVYELADVAFVGGSLEPGGGHNPLEPAAVGKVAVFGPSMENFREASERLLGADAAVQVRSGEELGAAWVRLLRDDETRKRMGRAAQGLVQSHRGATRATLEHLEALLAKPQG